MAENIQTFPLYFIAVIRLFIFFRIFNFILYKLIGNKIGYNKKRDWRRNCLMDLYFSLIYYAILIASKNNILISLAAAFIGSEIIVGIGEKIYTIEKNNLE